jgi:hypothetical protein
MTDESTRARLLTNSGKVIHELTYRCNVVPELVEIEDGGQAMIYEVADDDEDRALGLFVRLHSFENEKLEHTDFRSFIGKRIEVTIKVIDP